MKTLVRRAAVTLAILSVCGHTLAQPAQLPKTPQEALFYAAMNAMDPLAVVALGKGADPNFRIGQGRVTPLMVAANAGSISVIRTLLTHKADPNAADEAGRTPIIFAAMKNRRLAIQALLSGGANPAVRDRDGKSLLMYAAEYGDAGIARIFLAAYKPGDPATSFNNTPLMFAALGGNVDIIQALLKAEPGAIDRKNNAGETALLRAANQGRFHAVKALLDAGADRTAKDKSGKTPAEHARAQGHAETAVLLEGGSPSLSEEKQKQWLWTASGGGDCSTVQSILAAGVSADARAPDVGFTPLMLAAGAGQECAAELLIGKGADPSAASTKYGKTALMYAAERGQAEIVRLLIGKGADVNRAMNGGDTALHFAVSPEDDRADIIRILAAAGADLNARDAKGRTALIVAAGDGKKEAAGALIALGADTKATDPQGRSAVIHAASAGQKEILQMLAGVAPGGAAARGPALAGNRPLKDSNADGPALFSVQMELRQSFYPKCNDIKILEVVDVAPPEMKGKAAISAGDAWVEKWRISACGATKVHPVDFRIGRLPSGANTIQMQVLKAD